MFISHYRISIFLLCLMTASSGLSTNNNGDSGKISSEILTPEINHLFLNLKQSSIDSIARTPFICEHFAAFEQSEANAGSESWSGTYLIGQQAYLELFPTSGGLEGASEESAGIGLSTRQLGQFQSLKESLFEHAGDRAEDGLRVRVFNQDTISWFYWTSLKDSDSCLLSIWLMEFTDEYLNRIGVEIDSTRQFSRHNYLTAGATESDVIPTSSTLFDDIISVEFELTTKEHSDFKLLADAFGIKSSVSSNSSSFDFANCKVSVHVNEKRSYLVHKIVFSLTGAVDSPRQITFGPDASLEIGDSQAIWHFGL